MNYLEVPSIDDVNTDQLSIEVSHLWVDDVSIYDYWKSNKNNWFNHEVYDDSRLRVTGEKWINPDNDGVLSKEGVQQRICLILQYDQIYRHQNKDHIQEAQRLTLKETAFKLATKLSLSLRPYYDDLEDWSFVFVLLALRHNYDLDLKYIALNELKKRLKLDDTAPNAFVDEGTESGGGNGILSRFLHATIKDIHKWKEENIGYIDSSFHDEGSGDLNDFNKYREYLDPISGCKPKEWKNVSLKINLNTEQRTADNVPVNPGLEDMGYDDKQLTLRDMMDSVKALTENEERRIAVSISGGTDSMLLSFICALLIRAKEVDWKLILIYINYSNRDEASIEEEMIQQWAKYIDAPLYVRKIDEIHRVRSKALRATYEQITREIRFSMYKYFNCPILLGHNSDDGLENIFSNVSKRIHFDNIIGMKSVSYEDSVKLVRPMLGIQKYCIRMAMVHLNIPFLHDSTPKWSTRGKMRDGLLTEICRFNPAILSGFNELSSYVSFLESQWKTSFDDWLNSTKVQLFEDDNISKGVALGVDHIDNSITLSVDNASYLNKNIVKIVSIERCKYFEKNKLISHFWIQVWFSLKLEGRPTNKAFNDLITRLGPPSRKQMRRYEHGDPDGMKLMKVFLSKYVIVWYNSQFIILHLLKPVKQQSSSK